jgi:hypothetical protein
MALTNVQASMQASQLHFSLTSAGDFCKVDEKSELTWHNGDMRRDSVSSDAHKALMRPFPISSLPPWGGGRESGIRKGRSGL